MIKYCLYLKTSYTFTKQEVKRKDIKVYIGALRIVLEREQVFCTFSP